MPGKNYKEKYKLIGCYLRVNIFFRQSK